MIAQGARLSIVRIPLRSLVVGQYETRFPERVLHYIKLLADPVNAKKDPGLIHVRPLDYGYYEIEDGHHRFCAMILTGRVDALCLITEEA